VCEGDKNGDGCECSYRKAVYGQDTTRYFPKQAETSNDNTPGTIPQAVCSGGPYDGESCNPLAVGTATIRWLASTLTCINGANTGDCTPFTKIDSLLGQEGYCLEHDNTLKVQAADKTTNTIDTNACLTWLPIDTVQGNDPANQFLSAAFVPKINQESYCSAPAKYCVPHDCAQPTEALPFCTDLSTLPVTFTTTDTIPTDADLTVDNTTNPPTYKLKYGCFQGCPLDNTTAE